MAKMLTNSRLSQWSSKLDSLYNEIQSTFDNKELTQEEYETDKGDLVINAQAAIEQAVEYLTEAIGTKS